MSGYRHLRTDSGFAGAGDDFYAVLLAAHEGLSEQQSAELHTRLVLLLANHVGDLAVLREAITAARASLTSADSRGEPRA